MSLQPTKNDLPADTRQAMVALLNTALATVIDLAAQAKQAHWNVRGPRFISLHKFFDELYETAEGMVDDLAERITALGGFADGRIAAVSAHTKLPAYKAMHDGDDHLLALGTAFAAFATFTRKAIDDATTKGDAGTADLFTGMVRALDKALWMLDAHNAHIVSA